MLVLPPTFHYNGSVKLLGVRSRAVRYGSAHFFGKILQMFSLGMTHLGSGEMVVRQSY